MSQTDRLYGLVGGAAIKVPCRAATTGNITLSAEQTIDGVAVVTGDRVLVKSQTDQTENGIWVADTGDWERSKDFDGNLDVVEGTLLTVIEGSINAWTAWRVTTPDPVEIEGDNITFASAVFNDAATIYFIAAGAGAVQRTAQSKMREIVSVIDYGASNDGTNATITTAAFNAAVAAVVTAGGGDVYVPPGTYALNGTVTNASAVSWRIYGAGQQLSVINYTGAGYAFRFNALPSSSPFGGAGSISKMSILGTVGVSLGAVRVTDTVGMYVENLVIKNFSTGKGIWLENTSAAIFCEAATIRDVWVDNCLYGLETSVGGGALTSFDELVVERFYGRAFPAGGHMFHLHGTFNKSLFSCLTMFPSAANNQRMFYFVSTGSYNIGNHTIINAQFDGAGAGHALCDYNSLAGMAVWIHPYSATWTFLLNQEGLSGLSIVRPGQPKSLWLPIQSFTLVEGTPAITNYAGGGNPYDIVPAWAFDPAADEGVTGNFQLPADLLSVHVLVKVRLHWGPIGAVYGNVKWRVALKYIDTGATASDYWNGVRDELLTVVTAAPNPFPQLETVSDVSPANTARVIPLNTFRLCVERLGSDPQDTQTSDVALYGVEVVYTAVGDKYL